MRTVDEGTGDQATNLARLESGRVWIEAGDLPGTTAEKVQRIKDSTLEDRESQPSGRSTGTTAPAFTRSTTISHPLPPNTVMITAILLPHSRRYNQSSTKSRTIQLGGGCGSKLVPDERASLEPPTIQAKPHPLADRVAVCADLVNWPTKSSHWCWCSPCKMKQPIPVRQLHKVTRRPRHAGQVA